MKRQIQKAHAKAKLERQRMEEVSKRRKQNGAIDVNMQEEQKEETAEEEGK